MDAFKGIGNAISQGIDAVQDLAKGDIGGALSSGLGAAVNGFMATNPELSLVTSLGGMLGGLAGAAGGAAGGGGALPGIFGNIANTLGSVFQNPLGALGGIFGGGPPQIGGGGGGGGAAGGGTGLPDVNSTLGNIQNQLAGSLDLQEKMTQFQIQFQELSSLFKMLKDCGETAARNIA